MSWRGYVIFACASCILSGLSLVLWPINAVTMLFLTAGALPWTLRGELSPASGLGGLGPVILVSLLWPLTLAPLHWVSYRLLCRGRWMYASLFVAVNLLVALVLLLMNDNG